MCHFDKTISVIHFNSQGVLCYGCFVMAPDSAPDSNFQSLQTWLPVVVLTVISLLIMHICFQTQLHTHLLTEKQCAAYYFHYFIFWLYLFLGLNFLLLFCYICWLPRFLSDTDLDNDSHFGFFVPYRNKPNLQRQPLQDNAFFCFCLKVISQIPTIKVQRPWLGLNATEKLICVFEV